MNVLPNANSATSSLSLRPSNVPFGRTLCLKERTQDDDSKFGDNNESDGDDSFTSFTRSLSERIAQVEQKESSFVAGLQKRVQSVAEAEEFDSTMTLSSGDGKGQGSAVVELPVVCLDALLPNQRLAGSTTDPNFCNLLRSVGLGGMFVMTSLNNRQRKIRRFGVMARLELVDVDDGDENENEGMYDNAQFNRMLSSPTSVTFSIVGKRCCEVLGPAKGMKCRIGRWRRGYDPDGEESRLGWGEERFVDKSDELKSVEDVCETLPESKYDESQWNTNEVLFVSEDTKPTSDSIAKATYLIPLIERWTSLASDQTTYDNVDVVARTRRKSGQPGLTVNVSALLRKVQQELGPMPSPECPAMFAMWGAALINPLPALGVATEIRGAVLEAEGAEKKLGVLERGLIKSINNLDGTQPLNM